MSDIWSAATLAEQREMVRVMLAQVVCDPATKRLVALQPKAAFAPFFRQHANLCERDGVFTIRADGAEPSVLE